MSTESSLVLNKQGDITIIGFREPTLLDSYHISGIDTELSALIKQGHHRIVLDLGTIKMISSQALGVLLTIRQKLEPFGGHIVISGIDPRLYRVFKITNLQNKV